MDFITNLMNDSTNDTQYTTNDIVHTHMHHIDQAVQTVSGVATQCDMSATSDETASTTTTTSTNNSTYYSLDDQPIVDTAEHNRKFYRLRVERRERKKQARDVKETETDVKHEIHTITPEDNMTDLKNNNRIKQYNKIRSTIREQLSSLLYNSLFFEEFQDLDTEIIQAKNVIVSFLNEYDFLEPCIHNKYIKELIPEYIKLKYPNYRKKLDNSFSTIISDFITGKLTTIPTRAYSEDQLVAITNYNADKGIMRYQEAKESKLRRFLNYITMRNQQTEELCTPQEIFKQAPVITEMSPEQKGFRQAAMWRTAVGSAVLINAMINPGRNPLSILNL